MGGCGTSAVGSKSKKSCKEVAADSAPNPTIVEDSDYMEFLLHVLGGDPALSKLTRKGIESLSYVELKRLLDQDN